MTDEPSPGLRRDNDDLVVKAQLGTGLPLGPWGSLINPLLEASRFSPRWLYRILWGQQPAPRNSPAARNS